jgi:hypothetical protein
MMFSWLKYLNSFISRSVLKQNMEWSKGVIFLIATFWPDGLCSAELFRCLAAVSMLTSPQGRTIQHHTRPLLLHLGYHTAPRH